ncbi:MAG: ATP-binding cassette domain-containing protein, partial [Acidobacteriota bacterium]
MPSNLDHPLIELRAATKVYREGDRRRTIFEAVDLTITTGEQVALLGRSGSGKSTLLNLLSGIDLATAGEVRFDGTDLGTLSEHRRTLLRRHRIGFVFQAFNLLPTLSVEENLLLPLELAGRPSRRDRRVALDLLDAVGLGDRRASFPDVLSGG